MRLILALVLLLVIISGCAGGQDDMSDSSDGSSDAGSVDVSSGSGDKGNFADEPTKIKSLSGTSDLLENCLSIQDRMFGQMCAAAMNRDVKMCDDVKHSNANEQKYAQGICRAWVAGASKDPSICKSFEEGKELLKSDYSCYSMIARNARDDKYCDMIDDKNGQNGCRYRVALAKGTLKLSECKDTACVFDYAWRNNDKSVCDKFGDVTTAYLDMYKTSCLAMLSGDEKMCDPIKKQGVDNWYFCKTKAQYKTMMPSKGVFDFTSCKDDDECIEPVMDLMILESTR